MSGPRTVAMPGQVRGLAAPDATGPLFVTSYDGPDLSTTALTAVGLDGTVLWRREFDGRPGPPRVGDGGSVWVAHPGSGGQAVSELDADGAVLRSITLEHAPHEHLGAFVLLPDGICAAWLPAARRGAGEAGRTAGVARHDENGARRWSTPAVLDHLSHPGVVEVNAANGRQVRPMKPWTPRSIEVSHQEPLLVSGNRIAATFADGGSGIAVTFFLDVATGHVIATTRPGPSAHNAIAGPGEFLIGSQGYGVFSTARYDPSGIVTDEWPSNGMVLVDRHGHIRGPESENVLPSRSRFRGLNPGGTLRDGPALSGYYTAYPALDRDGTAIFWRDGRLLAVDADFEVHELFAMNDDRRVMSRVLLLDQGQAVFALHDELLAFSDTGLGPLDVGAWPCAHGNLRGNPVMYR
ncbi:hypothetical protein [Saccharothrix variisporea]|uniref:Uncharacterized protein n=1 Tax=Saccharothrix variisporea TaxID=543527 RepID=A0A495XIZ8_9PSEU|nr:hypothetical protein [Saccharothrix variisporea]RKT74471.1 hypothetical protein DFJ66_7831 [Saccharothrix variisporea]